MANPFLTHHTAAGKAFSAGDHSKAMHHIGHMMMAVRSAAKSAPSATTGPSASETMDPSLDDSGTDGMPNPAGIATPAPTPAKQHFFGQIGPKKPPSAKPHVAPPSQLGASNHVASGGFNKARFASLKGR